MGTKLHKKVETPKQIWNFHLIHIIISKKTLFCRLKFNKHNESFLISLSNYVLSS